MILRFLTLVALLFASLAGYAQSAKSPLIPQSLLPPQKTASVFGQKIAYYDVGTGPTVVLVHGFGSQAIFDWGAVVPSLAQHHRVIALDQIGWGQSDKPLIDYSIQTFVDFLGEFLRTLKVDHFTLDGESMGGWVVARYTIEALSPTNAGPFALPKPDRLILQDAAGHRARRTDGPAPVAGTLADTANIAVIYYNKSLVTPEFVREAFALKLRANDGHTQRSLRANPRLDSEVIGGQLGAITIPTLVVWGGKDEVVPLSDGEDYAAKIPHARLVVIPDCGHVASMEKPQEFVAALAGFLP